MTDDIDKSTGKKGSLTGQALALIRPTLHRFNPDTWSSAARSLAVDAASTVSASSGGVAVAGNNTGSIININAEQLTLAVERQVIRELPSYLSKVVAKFSDDWSGYNSGPQRVLGPEVDVKLAYNDFPSSHFIITDFTKFLNILEASYRGVEQSNDDARRLVRRRAGVEYANQLQHLCVKDGIKNSQAHAHARKNAIPLVLSVVEALLDDVSAGSSFQVMKETAHLAVCLIVADAIIECDVLERPINAVAS